MVIQEEVMCRKVTLGKPLTLEVEKLQTADHGGKRSLKGQGVEAAPRPGLGQGEI